MRFWLLKLLNWSYILIGFLFSYLEVLRRLKWSYSIVLHACVYFFFQLNCNNLGREKIIIYLYLHYSTFIKTVIYLLQILKYLTKYLFFHCKLETIPMNIYQNMEEFVCKVFFWKFFKLFHILHYLNVTNGDLMCKKKVIN